MEKEFRGDFENFYLRTLLKNRHRSSFPFFIV